MKKYWFKAKRYGWGWGLPATWQGWVIFGIYGAFMFWSFYHFDSTSHSGSDTLIAFFPSCIIATLILIGICWKTGEPPRWRWGD